MKRERLFGVSSAAGMIALYIIFMVRVGGRAWG